MKGYLVLEDGTVFTGEAFGAAGESVGEVVFNTGMTGYQEVLTDPSYCGQIVTMTYPLIGNYGINKDDFESARSHVAGFIVKELCRQPSHWQAVRTLDDFLVENGVAGLSGVDTRALTRHLRKHGTLKGVLITLPESVLDAQTTVSRAIAQAAQFEVSKPVARVTTPHPYRIFGGGPRIVVVDLGAKQNILRCLRDADCDLIVVPAGTSAQEIIEMQPQGVLYTNGPGNPKDVAETVAAARELIEGTRLPIFGICLGHQVLGLAMGADTFRLKFGHRGCNHPVKDFITNRVYITSQNHSYAIDENSLGNDVEVTHRSLNDNTVEGLKHKHRAVFSVQYHPEAHPGPEESRYLFNRFLAQVS